MNFVARERYKTYVARIDALFENFLKKNSTEGVCKDTIIVDTLVDNQEW